MTAKIVLVAPNNKLNARLTCLNSVFMDINILFPVLIFKIETLDETRVSTP